MGSVLAAGFLGALLGLAGQYIVPRIAQPALWLTFIVAPASLLYALAEGRLVRLPYPMHKAQVPEIWRRILPPQLAALLYGLTLGIGFGTRITTSTFYIVTLGVIVWGNALYAALTFSLFGLSRALPVALIGWYLRSANTCEHFHARFCRIADQKDRIHFYNAFALALVGGYWLTGIWLLL